MSKKIHLLQEIAYKNKNMYYMQKTVLKQYSYFNKNKICLV